MKTTKKILAAMLSTAVMGNLAVMASAEEVPAGHIVFAADKNTIGQGFVTEPVLVPYYEGEKGIEIVQRAAEVIVTESDYGDYVSAFADVDTGAEIPTEVAAVCPEMFGRTAEGYLSAYDYTSESGWSYFVNDEYAMVGISDYTPADGDVVWFRFTVYGYGCDLGIDNSSWGGNPALVEQVQVADLMTAVANSTDLADTTEYANAIEVLETYGATRDDITAALDALSAQPDTPTEGENTQDNKGSADTGIEGVAVLIGAAAVAGVALTLSKKR